MFNFFTDIKNRLTAVEQHIAAIYAHLRADKPTNASVDVNKVTDPNVGNAVPATAVAVSVDSVATEPTNNGTTPGTESN